MYKIRRITYKNHPILKNLTLDFCKPDGKAVDTIIFAGENGTGKSTILDSLYKIVSRTAEFEALVEFEKNNEVVIVDYNFHESRGKRFLYVSDGSGMNAYIKDSSVEVRHPTNGIYSDVDINFRSTSLSSVTSLALDEKMDSRRSSSNLPTEIKQLLIDIQALDDGDLAQAYREAKEKNDSTNDLIVDQRIPRFTSAFSVMFDDLSYNRIANKDSHKEILFRKNREEIPIDGLSSGEKQIVYRGCFLLKDINAMNGAFVFIDEPEISLHPKWQNKIMDYYCGIFTNEEGHQTSQIIASTHSPFIIHNENRKRDKVIVLVRNENGDTVVQDKPQYYKCDSIEVVEDAFDIHFFPNEQPTVYLEGRTDQKYFYKAAEVFGYSDLPFRFKWVGYIDNDNGQERNTGKDALRKAAEFLIARSLPYKNVCLFDSDANQNYCAKSNVITYSITHYMNTKNMRRGIENALLLDAVDMADFYAKKESIGEYGERKNNDEFDKMKCCDHICGLDNDVLQIVLSNLRTEIDILKDIFK